MIGKLFKGIFIPERIGSYYPLSTRIIGFDINKTMIHASKVILTGRNVVIDKTREYALEADNTKSFQERVSAAIRSLIQELGPFDEIRTSLSSSLVIYKELTLPFSDQEKIENVLPFEIEQYLPFSVQDAIIDFIITKQDAQQHCDILIAAVKKEYLIEHLTYFQAAGIEPTAITIDLFDLYGLYKNIPAYAQLEGGVVLVDIGFSVTHIAYILNGQLRAIRSLPRGLITIAKALSVELNTSLNEALEEFIRFGLERYDNQEYITQTQKAFTSFWDEIQFTCTSFATRITPLTPLSTILLLGYGATISKLALFIEKQYQTKCSLFDIHELFKNPTVSTKNHRIAQSTTLSIATAWPTPTTQSLNVRKREFSLSTSWLFTKQVITASVLIVCLTGLFFTHRYFQFRKLRQAYSTAEKEIKNYLKEKNLSSSANIDQAINETREKIETEQEIWFAFSSQVRFSFLYYLQELSGAIDRQSIGLDLTKLTITYDTITMDGEVKGFEELKIFERELKESNLFTFVPSIQNIKFKNVTLVLKKTGDLK